MASHLKNSVGGLPISIDPTFNFGAFEVTPLTYRHHIVESKSKNFAGKWNPALLLGPTLIHHSKTEDVFDTGLRVMSRKTELSSAKIGIVTDGEEALIKACKNNFPKSISLRCTNHFKENCKDFLKSVGIVGITKQAALLDIVFGRDGLVEAENKKDLRQRLNSIENTIGEIEEQVKEDSNNNPGSFYSFLKQREKSVLRKLIRDTRKNGGMPIDGNNAPKRVFTNQSESCNAMLSAQKQAFGYARKEDLSKSNFIKNVWLSVVNAQDEEIQKALFGQSDKFRLKEEAMYLQVSVEDWFSWTHSKRERYVVFQCIFP